MNDESMNRYDALRNVLKWCKKNARKDFCHSDVGVNSHLLSSLCGSTYRGNIWIVKKGKMDTRDGTNGLIKYSLASWIDIDNVGHPL
jgi:hypothetical protein